MNPRGTLCKLGTANRIRALREDGCVYMSTLDTFWSIEDGGVRGDRLDGICEMLRGKHGVASRADGTGSPVNISAWTFETRPTEPKKINLYCMYALRWDSGVVNVDERVNEFGDAALVFTDPNQFLERLYAALQLTERYFRADLVEYVPDDHVGEVGIFRKTARYSFQSEWRVACYDGLGEPLVLNLGSLAGISKLVPPTELKTLIEVSP